LAIVEYYLLNKAISIGYHAEQMKINWELTKVTGNERFSFLLESGFVLNEKLALNIRAKYP
jgi:hypothetical protein